VPTLSLHQFGAILRTAKRKTKRELWEERMWRKMVGVEAVLGKFKEER
jgi:hypothetical protein